MELEGAAEEEGVVESEASSEVGSIGEDAYERIVAEDEQQREEKDQYAYEDYVEAYLKESHDPNNMMPINRTRDLMKNVEAVVEFL